jgi:hypothetical protein
MRRGRDAAVPTVAVLGDLVVFPVVLIYTGAVFGLFAEAGRSHMGEA